MERSSSRFARIALATLLAMTIVHRRKNEE